MDNPVSLRIATCGDCPFVDHSGAFTPGGAKSICGHVDAYKTFGRNKKGQERYEWRHRMVNRSGSPPELCPLRRGV